MEFNTPAGPNPIDRLRVVGRPIDRVDGPLKVTGRARYAHEQHNAAPNQLHGYLLHAAIAKGRIRRLDVRAALAAPGVVDVITHLNAGRVQAGEFYAGRPLGGPEIDFYHQAIGVVVAETWEQARSAAGLVKVDYGPSRDGAYVLAETRDGATAPERDPDLNKGDFETAFEAAPYKVDETYSTPDQSHAMMEPHASLAVWNGDEVTVWTSVQIVNWAVRDLAKAIGHPAAKIRIVTPFIGGGFGGKATVLADAVLAAIAARKIRRPVRIALSRPEMFNNTTHRPATLQRVRLGADAEGRLLALGHESLSGNLKGGPAERSTLPTRSLYACANRRLITRLSHLDLPEGNAMRAPGETPGMMAFEIAMDELAEKLKLDPVELRIRNDAEQDPEKPERRFSTRPFVECLRTGAERFGWSRRSPQPGTRREGRWLIGMGVASAIRGDNVTNSSARVRLTREGRIVVETDMTDIGTGSYTILAQTAAEMMGVPVDRVTVRLGDSMFPETSGSLGQRGANSATSAVYAACVRLRDQVASNLGLDPERADFIDGKVRMGRRSFDLASAAAGSEIVAEEEIRFGEERDALAHQTFGAHFCEVEVDGSTGETRLRRMLAVCASGRILNPKTARSQVIGAMTMGAGAALMEELVVDSRLGLFINHDMAEYAVPVHADIPHQDVVFVDEVDPTSSPMKAKGVGELGISGVGAAIANAVYNATGVRVRNYPLTLDKLIGGLPDLA